MGSRRAGGGQLDRWLAPIGGPFPRLRIVAALALFVALLWPIDAPPPAPAHYDHDHILGAICMVESGGRVRPPDGDGGRAIGPFQIHRRYWLDSKLSGDYQDCRQRGYAERVVEAYMRRWIPEAWRDCDAEVIARTHNGGPRGRYKRATDGYWSRVARRLREPK